MLNFCTLFDINFISQGLSMYESLKEHCKNDFTLYIFAFCDESYKLLKDLNLDNVKIISLSELENGVPALKEVKSNRTKGEYCWTCGSASIKYCIEQQQFFRAQKILERVETCWGICRDLDNINSTQYKGCGCHS